MSCEFILQRGKNKGKQCSLKGKMMLNTRLYCTRHYRLREKQCVLSEKSIMKMEDFNCNGISTLTLGKFIAIREIGKGAFGQVLIIRHTDTQEHYALKITSTRGQDADLLYYEYLLLSQHFTGNNAFPTLLPKMANSYKRTKNETYLIMEYFEETLDYLHPWS